MSLSKALGLLPDVHIHASLVLCALVLTWMVAIHRRANAQQSPRRTRRNPMTRTTQTGSATPQGEDSTAVRPSSSGPHRSIVSKARASRPAEETAPETTSTFRIRWDRTALALVGVIALVTFVIAGIAALFGAGTGATAGIALLITALSVVALRWLAVRDRKLRTDRRIEAAFEEASAPIASGPLFDAAAPAAWAVPATPAENTTTQSSTEDTVEGPATAQIPTTTAATPARTEAQASLPSVPRPTYLDAPEAIRPEVEPLEVPAQPTAAPGTRLKDGVSPEYTARVQATANRTLDLDKVLERRRAV